MAGISLAMSELVVRSAILEPVTKLAYLVQFGLEKGTEGSALVRRAPQMFGNGLDEPGSPEKPALSGLAALTIILSVIFVIVAIGLMQYPIKLLLTLVIVESPPAVYLPLENDEEAAALGASPKPHLTPHGDSRVFVTSSIFGTFKHLRQLAGKFSPWRGLWANVFLAIANSTLRGIFVGVLNVFLPFRLASMLGGIASIVVLSKYSLVVTHIMISSPQPGTWWSRARNTTWAQAKPTIPALVLFAVATQATVEFALFSNNPEFNSGARFGILSADVIASLFLVIPASVLLIRVQASILADDVQTVVPFDKTFGQDTSATNGVLTLKMAINTLDVPLAKRVGLFLLKAMPAVSILSGILIALLIAEVILIGVNIPGAV